MQSPLNNKGFHCFKNIMNNYAVYFKSSCTYIKLKFNGNINVLVELLETFNTHFVLLSHNDKCLYVAMQDINNDWLCFEKSIKSVNVIFYVHL